MDINKEDLFKDFLANKQKKMEERKEKLESIEQTKQPEKQEKIVPVKNKKNKKNRNRKPVVETKKEIVPVEKGDIYSSEKFLKFKELFMSNQIVKDFMTSLDLYRERGFNIFDNNDYFIKAKMEHPNCRAVIVEPSLADITVGKAGNVYIVKPMYQKEYFAFQKLFGDRASHNEEFITYSILQCVLYPENLTEQDIEKIGAGTIITLYNTISNLSDFNKNFTVVEV